MTLSRDTTPFISTNSTTTAKMYVGRYNRAYFYAFIIVLLLCWSPSKLLGYLAPWLALGWFLLATRSHRTLRNSIVLFSLWFGLTLVHALLTPGFVAHSAILSFITYGAFFFIAAIPTKFIVADGRTMRQTLAVARWIVLFQGSWAVSQAILAASRTGTFDGATGDAVAGTIRPLGFSPDLSNPIFAINMALLLVFLLPSLVLERKGLVPVVLGTVSLIMASVVHVLLLLGISLVLAFIIYSPSFFRQKRGIITTVGFVTMVLLASNLLSHNFSTARNFARYTLDGRTPRAQVILRAVDEMPGAYPWMPIIGLGPGQFSSRAGLIGTGLYFGTPLNPTPIPLLPTDMSIPFEKYVSDLWFSLFFDSSGNAIHSMDNTSSTVKPYFSWLSMYTEFGLLGFAMVVILSGWVLLRVRRRVRTPAQRLTAVSFGTGLIFIFLIGIQENYWEVPQAILVGITLLKVQYANLIYLDNSPNAPTT